MQQPPVISGTCRTSRDERVNQDGVARNVVTVAQIVGGLAASSWVAFDPIPAAVKFAATGVKFVLIFG